MGFPRLLAGMMLCAALIGQEGFFALKDVRPGLRGVGKTVFSGSRIEEFQVEILGVLENVGPRQSLILARLSGGPLENTGVLQGMSGSPVYIDGRLLGAVAMSFPFSKEPVAAIRPIRELLLVGQEGSRPRMRARVSPLEPDLTLPFPPPAEVMAGDARLVDIATPVSFSGFTRNALEHFAPQLRALGLEPRQGISGGGSPAARLGDPSALEPGSMISVQLLAGDLSVAADGTVTWIDGRNVYAFGHRFLSIGSTELPFARSEVLALLPNLSSSFKISSPREWMGAITEDRNTAIAGRLGQRAEMVPVSISLSRRSPAGSSSGRTDYRLEMVNDRVLAPFLVQVAVFSCIDATERTVGSSTLALEGKFEFSEGTAPVRLRNMFSGDFSVPLQASLATAVPLAYALQSGLENLQLKNVTLSIESFDERKQAQIDQVWTSRREVRPGEPVELTVVLAGANGAEITRKTTYSVPVGAPAGPLFFTVADGTTTNFTDLRQVLTSTPKSSSQLVAFLNALRGNTKAYVRVWRPEPNYDVQGQDFPDPPPSVAQVLARSQGGAVPAFAANSKVAEMEVDAGEVVVTGSRTVQVEVKE